MKDIIERWRKVTLAKAKLLKENAQNPQRLRQVSEQQLPADLQTLVRTEFRTEAEDIFVPPQADSSVYVEIEFPRSTVVLRQADPQGEDARPGRQEGGWEYTVDYDNFQQTEGPFETPQHAIQDLKMNFSKIIR